MFNGHFHPKAIKYRTKNKIKIKNYNILPGVRVLSAIISSYCIQWQNFYPIYFLVFTDHDLDIFFIIIFSYTSEITTIQLRTNTIYTHPYIRYYIF